MRLKLNVVHQQIRSDRPVAHIHHSKTKCVLAAFRQKDDVLAISAFGYEPRTVQRIRGFQTAGELEKLSLSIERDGDKSVIGIPFGIFVGQEIRFEGQHVAALGGDVLFDRRPIHRRFPGSAQRADTQTQK